MSNYYWERLERKLEDPNYLREFVVESIRTKTIDDLINGLDEARAAAGLTKAALARAVNARPETVRRLLSQSGLNPTLGTVVELAAALGLRLEFQPLSDAERELVTDPLQQGRHADPKELARAHSARLVS